MVKKKANMVLSVTQPHPSANIVIDEIVIHTDIFSMQPHH